MANVDVTGDGIADTGAVLSNLGITDAERQQLGGLYAAGNSLWRVPIKHFTNYDINWGFSAPNSAGQPNGGLAGKGGGGANGGQGPGMCFQRGSRIECQRQVLGEEVALAGTLGPSS